VVEKNVMMSYDVNTHGKKEMMLKHDSKGVNSPHEGLWKTQLSLPGFLRYRKPESFVDGTHSPNPVISPFG